MGSLLGHSFAVLVCGFLGGLIFIIPGAILGSLNSGQIPTFGNDFGFIFVGAAFGATVGYVIGAAVGTVLFLRAAHIDGRWWGAGIVCTACFWLCFRYKFLLWIENPYIEYLIPLIAGLTPLLAAMGYRWLPMLFLSGSRWVKANR